MKQVPTRGSPRKKSVRKESERNMNGRGGEERREDINQRRSRNIGSLQKSRA